MEDQRAKLVKELQEVNKQWLNSEGSLVWGLYLAEWIIEDRKRIVQPLVITKELLSQTINSHNKQCVLLFNAIDETLKLAGIDEKG